MLTTLGVDARVLHYQPLNGFAADDVSIDNLIHIFGLHPAIPDSIGIHHQIRTMLALVEAARLVGSDFAFQTTFRQLLLEELL